MENVMRKSVGRLHDSDTAMEIPMGAIVIAPLDFFERFGNQFHQDIKIPDDLKTRPIFHAVKSDRKDFKYFVRHIPNDTVKAAMAGDMREQILHPVHPYEEYLGLKIKHEVEVAPKVNVFKMTKAQLIEKAAELELDASDMTRQELIKVVNAKLNEPEPEKE